MEDSREAFLRKEIADSRSIKVNPFTKKKQEDSNQKSQSVFSIDSYISSVKSSSSSIKSLSESSKTSSEANQSKSQISEHDSTSIFTSLPYKINPKSKTIINLHNRFMQNSFNISTENLQFFADYVLPGKKDLSTIYRMKIKDNKPSSFKIKKLKKKLYQKLQHTEGEFKILFLFQSEKDHFFGGVFHFISKDFSQIDFKKTFLFSLNNQEVFECRYENADALKIKSNDPNLLDSVYDSQQQKQIEKNNYFLISEKKKKLVLGLRDLTISEDPFKNKSYSVLGKFFKCESINKKKMLAGEESFLIKNAIVIKID